jgi:hypothetical protein
MGTPHLRGAAFVASLLAVSLAPTGARAQSEPVDSAEVLEQLHKLQSDFERYRESRIPVEVDRANGACDQRIGRFCIWFGGADEEKFPAEFREVVQARTELIRSLFDAREQLHDRWVLGQLVNYLVENGNMDEAQRVATECGIAEKWWCSALRGYVLHVWTRYVDAEKAFRESLDEMPDSVWDAWTTPRYILTPDAVKKFNSAAPADRERQFNLFWRLSDPFFLFEGNDRFTDHFARWVLVENREDAANAYGMDWEDDMAETVVRYGRETGYSRTHNPSRTMGFGQLNDTRRVVGHQHPMSRGYLFPERFLQSPSDIPPESWITAPREARTWYAPPYAPDVRGLETQVGRFRRDDVMLVVGAYRPTLPDPEAGGRVVSAWGSDGGVEGKPYAGLFLIPEDGRESIRVQSNDAEGVMTIKAPPGKYVSGLEVVDPAGRRGWRARQGIVQHPLVPGLVDVSDLMILREGAPLPASLDEAIPDIRPGVRLKQGERFAVVWEVYGLRIQEPVRVTIGFSKGRPGFLSRVGDFLGAIEPDRPVDITFDDTGPDRVQAAFRAVELELPDLDPGDYTLHLRLELAGRTPVVTSRPIIVEG